MVEMAFKYKLDWENIAKILIYLFLIGIIIVLFYYLVAIPAIKVLSNPFPGVSPFCAAGFFNMKSLV